MTEKSWTVTLEDTNDGTGDAILPFPDELVEMKGWKEGTVFNLEVVDTGSGKALIITEVKE